MKRLLLLLLLTGRAFAVENEPIPWHADLDAALKLAKEKKRLVFVDFTATWCGPCQVMNRVTFRDREVILAMERVIPVKIDFDSNRRLAQRYNVRSLPSLLLVDANGEVIQKGFGLMEAEPFIEWLNEGVATTGEAVPSPKVDPGIASYEARILSEGKPALDEFFSIPDPLTPRQQESVKAVLNAIADQKPALLAPYLNAEKLAVRIMASNALGAQIPADVKYDPWQNASEREKALSRIKWD